MRIFRSVTLIVLMGISMLACATTYVDQRSKSAHFREGQFHNPVSSAKSFWSFLRMRARTTYAPWPKWIEAQSFKPKSERVFGDEIVLTHINHSTVLIQTEGLNLLTDPIFSERCSPVSWAGPKRVRRPGIEFSDLPPIDVILISHDHYDHLDLPTIQKLVERDRSEIFLGLGVGAHLKGVDRVREMDWWESVSPREDLKVHFVPVQHFSGRGLFDRNSTLWGGFVVEVGGRKIYFGGDAGYSPHFRQTRERLGEMDIALIPVGAYEPRDFMAYAHVNPEEAVRAHVDLGAKLSMGIHYGTFQLTAEPIDAPLLELKAALAAQGISETAFITPEFGVPVRLGPKVQ